MFTVSNGLRGRLRKTDLFVESLGRMVRAPGQRRGNTPSCHQPEPRSQTREGEYAGVVETNRSADPSGPPSERGDTREDKP